MNSSTFALLSRPLSITNLKFEKFEKITLIKDLHTVHMQAPKTLEIGYVHLILLYGTPSVANQLAIVLDICAMSGTVCGFPFCAF